MSGELPGLEDRSCMRGFSQVPAEIYRTVTSHRAIVLWGVLDIHQGGYADCKVGRDHLAEDLGWSVDSVKRALYDLERAGWLEVSREPNRGRSNINRYRVLGRPGKRGRTAPFSVDNHDEKGGRSAPFLPVDSQENGADLHRENGADLHRRTIGNEPERNTAAYSTTDRARESVDKCSHDRPLAVDGTGCALCAEQRQLWPTAVGE